MRLEIAELTEPVETDGNQQKLMEPSEIREKYKFVQATELAIKAKLYNTALQSNRLIKRHS